MREGNDLRNQMCAVGEASSNEEKYKWRAAICQQEYDETPAGMGAYRKLARYLRTRTGLYDLAPNDALIGGGTPLARLTIVRTARPFSFQPSNGVLQDKLAEAAESTVHSKSGSISVTSPAAPNDRVPPSRFNKRAGLTVNDAVRS